MLRATMVFHLYPASLQLNMKFLALILYYNYVNVTLGGKLVEGYLGLLCMIFATSCEIIIILK